MERTTDMTKGSILKLVLTFSIPLIFTNIGHQLYLIADAAIVGRGVGIKALAAVGAVEWSYWMVSWTISGLTQAFSTFVARYYGDKNYHNMNKTIAMSVLLCAVISTIITVTGMIGAKPLLSVLDTPDDIMNDAVLYLSTMFCGIIIVTAYNMAGGILRALGDGKSPLVAMVIAAVLNIGLDLLFVMVFRWGIFGAALASVLAQLVSFVYCFCQLKKIKCIEIDKATLKPNFGMIKELLVFGIPLSLQYTMIALGGMILQSTINLQGSVFVAGFTAVNKIYGLFECTAISIGAAISTFIAQNYGAGNILRVRKGVRTGEKVCVVAAIIVMVIVFATGKTMLQAFLDTSMDGGKQALAIGTKYLYYMLAFIVVLYMIHIYRNILQAIGNSTLSLLSGVAEFVVRVFLGKVVIVWAGVETLYFVEPAAWTAALLVVVIPYYAMRNKLLPINQNS